MLPILNELVAPSSEGIVRSSICIACRIGRGTSMSVTRLSRMARGMLWFIARPICSEIHPASSRRTNQRGVSHATMVRRRNRDWLGFVPHFPDRRETLLSTFQPSISRLLPDCYAITVLRPRCHLTELGDRRHPRKIPTVDMPSSCAPAIRHLGKYMGVESVSGFRSVTMIAADPTTN